MEDGVGDGVDGWDDGVDDRETLGELGEVGCGETLAELVLEDGGADGYAPDLADDRKRE